MTDTSALVKRLRVTEWGSIPLALMQEAADALEALRAERDDWQSCYNRATNALATLRAENERLKKNWPVDLDRDVLEREIDRLRAALEKIKNLDLASEAWEIARSALGGLTVVQNSNRQADPVANAECHRLRAALEKIVRWGKDTHNTSLHVCVIASAALANIREGEE